MKKRIINGSIIRLPMCMRSIFLLIVFISFLLGQDYDSNTGKPKETSGNEEKVSWSDGILSFKQNPIILKKGDDEILINPGEKIKVITTDGNIVIGMYYKISILKKEIIVRGKKNSKIFYEDIKQISRGIGNKSVEYGTTGAILGFIGGFVLGNIIVTDAAYRGVTGAIFGIGGGIGGLVGGLGTGFKTPIDLDLFKGLGSLLATTRKDYQK